MVIYFQNVSGREWDIIHNGFSHGHQQEEQVWEWLSKFNKNIWCTSCGRIKPQTCLTSPAFLITRLHDHWFSHDSKNLQLLEEKRHRVCVWLWEKEGGEWPIWFLKINSIVYMFFFFTYFFFHIWSFSYRKSWWDPKTVQWKKKMYW